MQFLVLGPLEVRAPDGPVAIGPPRVRAVLALLLVRPNTIVGVDRFVDELWPAEPPSDARGMVHGYLSRLRRALRRCDAADRLVTRKPGYMLRIGDGALDRDRFERLVAEARAATPERAAELYRAAHALWRGAPFADVPTFPAVAAESARLTELHLSTREELVELELAAGRHAQLVAELTDMVARYPLRERPVGQLMLALHRAGRTGEALDTYRRAAATLADELGIEPGSELQRVHMAILKGEALTAAPARAVAQLPPATAGFAGRSAELARLDALLASTGTVVISALSGTAGVGKTALAVHWAHRVAERFPDGQLYVNLRGFGPGGSAVTPEDALHGFLDALAVPAPRIPSSLDERSALFRSLLAGRRVLVVLDNARDAGQVRPLLPGAPGCLALVTSRSQLTGLVAGEGAQAIILDVLSTVEARQLLANRIGTGRTASEPEAVDDIVASTARLPLALAVVAARVITRPQFPLRALADDLHRARGGLDAFAADDPATDVRAVFSWSYRALGADAARLFRLLGLHPGADLTVPAAASLAGVPEPRVRSLLAELVQAHLATEHRPGRYTCHDLLRAYAAETTRTLDTVDARDAARRRLLDHYLHTAVAAGRLLAPHRTPVNLSEADADVTVAGFDDRAQAQDWFAAEHPALLAILDLAAGARLDTHAWQLAWALGGYLDRRGYWRDWVRTQRLALDAARRLGDALVQARAHRTLARALCQLGLTDEAGGHLELAVVLARDHGSHAGEAQARLDLGWILERHGRYREALDHALHSLDLYRKVGHAVGEANALNASSWLHTRLGDYPRALAAGTEALARQEETGDRLGAASTWDTLGYAHHQLGQYREAVACYRRALDLQRDLGERHRRAIVLVHLGDTHLAAGDPAAAEDAWRQALSILDDIDHPDAERLRAKLQPGGQ